MWLNNQGEANKVSNSTSCEVIKKRKRSDEQDNDLFSPTESKVSKNELSILDPVTFRNWKEESVASLLCSPIEQGGVNLSLEYAQQFYEAQFNYNKIAYTRFLINEGESLNTLFTESLPNELPTRVKESVIEWVKNLYERNLYHLWSNEKLSSELCKPIQEGGAGLNNNDLVNIPDLKEFVINSSNIENGIEKLIIKWKNSFLIQYEPIDFSITLEERKRIQFYLNIKKKILANSKDVESTVQNIYQNCYEEEKTKVNNTSNIPTIEELIKLVKFEKPNLKLICANDLKINELTKEGVHLPIVKSGKEYSFNKHHLPFIPSLHYENEFDSKVVLEIEQSTTPPSFILISSSGIGKTSLMIRTLCKYPGIFITGTSAFENCGTIDLASQELMQQLSQSPSRSFATIRQLCHLLIISKILHINSLIDSVISDNKLLDSFEGNLFSFLAFNQFGYQNTMNDYLIFEQILKYEWCEIDDLRKLTIQSVNFLKQKLSNLSNSIYNSNNLDKLVICIDEANVFEEYSPIKFISSGGNEKGFLNVLTYEIELLKKETFNSSFYAGTSFSVDISNIVQSVPKSESNIINLAQFPKLDKKEFFNYVSKHIVLDTETRESIEKENTFPLRIRNASYFLEMYINAKLNRFSTFCIFETCFDDAFDYVTKKIEKFIAWRNKKERSTSIKDTLFNYILHFRFGAQFGTSFIEHDSEIASELLTSGLTNPTNNLDSFEANDYLGYEVALEIVGMRDDSQLTVMKLVRYWLSKTKDPNYIEKLTKLCSTELQL